jgi:hypothetical protein
VRPIRKASPAGGKDWSIKRERPALVWLEENARSPSVGLLAIEPFCLNVNNRATARRLVCSTRGVGSAWLGEYSERLFALECCSAWPESSIIGAFPSPKALEWRRYPLALRLRKLLADRLRPVTPDPYFPKPAQQTASATVLYLAQACSTAWVEARRRQLRPDHDSALTRMTSPSK